MKSFSVCFLLLTITTSLLTAQDKSQWLMDAEREILLAESGGPPAVGPGAAIHLLEADGYTVVREGTNGFNCMVRRLGSYQDVLPICFDEEASRTVMPIHQQMVVMLMAGKSLQEILAIVQERYADGTYQPPVRGSVAYMMSAEQKFFNARADSAVSYFPHVMVYIPNLTMEDIGGGRERINGVPVPFVASPGTPGSYMMIPTGPRGNGVKLRMEAN